MLRTILRAYILFSIILLSQAAIWPGATLGQSKIYWTDYDGGVFQEVIQRADLDGSNLENVLTTRLDEPTSLELDLSSGKLYWSDAGEIGRSNLDGSGVEKAITFESGPIVTPISSGVSLDETAGKLYWIQGGVIHRANLDGSEAEEVITDNVVESDGLEVDPTGGKVYWTNSEFSGGVVRRANLDGTGIEDLVAEGFSPKKIDLDVDGGKMYWTDFISNAVFRANLDGSSVEEIVGEEQDNPEGIAVDVTNAKVYWTDLTEDAVRRANLDGSEVEELPLEVERPVDVEVDPAAGFLYVVAEDGELYRSNLDGTESELHIVPVAGMEHLVLDADVGKLYFYGFGGGLQRSNLDGSGVENVADNSPDDIYLDLSSGTLYLAQSDGIHRADLDGSNAELLVESDRPNNLTLDFQGSKIFWTGDGNIASHDKIRSANLDGSEPGILLDNLDDVNQLMLDADGGHLYWTEGGFSFASVIRRANLDGTGVTDIVDEQVGGRVVLRPDEGKIYWSDYRIRRANLDGSNVEELHAASFGIDWLTLDPAGGKMYWITEERIERANLDGSGVETVVTDLEQPQNLILAASVPTSIEELPVNDRGYSLEAPYPNPFQDRATITVTLERSQHVNVHLYNALGQRVSTPHSGWLSAGTPHQLTVDAAGKSGGVYLYQIAGEDFRATGTVTLMK